MTLWHLITTNDTIVRSAHAVTRDEARLRLAPIGPHQMVVSAMSYEIKEPREIVAIRQLRCEICGELMSDEKGGIYRDIHRSCYQKQWRDSMSPDQREAFLAKRRAYKLNGRE